MTFNRMSIAAVGALGTLALAACGPAQENAAADGTVTESVTSTADSANDEATETVTQAAEPGAGAAAGQAAEGAPAPEAAPAPAPAPAEQGSGAVGYVPIDQGDGDIPPITDTHLDIGDAVSVRGHHGVACSVGDGFAVNKIVAGPNTSCDFAIATFEALTDGGNATYDNVRDNIAEPVTVHSPVTGQDYQMSCRNDEDKLVTCRGGDDAAVFMR